MINEENLALNNQEVLRLTQQFPLLAARPELVYLDNAATTHKPQAVLQAISDFYTRDNANPLRGLYELSAQATAAYEAARARVAAFIGAAPEEVVFTSGASASLNLAALTLGEYLADSWTPESEIVVSVLEHHSNLLVWQRLARQVGARLVYAEPEATGQLDAARVIAKISDHTKIVAITGMSNVLGQVIDVAAITRAAHRHGALVIVDAAQLIAHVPVDVRALEVDGLAFSGHKLYGPMGIGALYWRRALAEKLPPAFVGGEMIASVTRTDFVPAPSPQKFEAGTVNAAGAVGLAAALDWLETLGWEAIQAREQFLTTYLLDGLRALPHVRLVSTPVLAPHGVVSFTLEGVHPHDVATILGSQQICVRAGHHCAAVLHEFLGVPATTRASVAWYNTRDQLDQFLAALGQVRSKLGYDD